LGPMPGKREKALIRSRIGAGRIIEKID